MRGTVALRAAPASPFSGENSQGHEPDTVTFQISPSGAGGWKDLKTVPQGIDASGNPVKDPATGLPLYTYKLDTTTVPDGPYDIRVLGQDASPGDDYVGGVASGVLVDNTPPSVALTGPGGSLSGVVNLEATATDSGSGVASVRFEISPAGADTWSTIGVQSALWPQTPMSTSRASTPADSRTASTTSMLSPPTSPGTPQRQRSWGAFRSPMRSPQLRRAS